MGERCTTPSQHSARDATFRIVCPQASGHLVWPPRSFRGTDHSARGYVDLQRAGPASSRLIAFMLNAILRWAPGSGNSSASIAEVRDETVV